VDPSMCPPALVQLLLGPPLLLNGRSTAVPGGGKGPLARARVASHASAWAGAGQLQGLALCLYLSIHYNTIQDLVGPSHAEWGSSEFMHRWHVAAGCM
jgi:hypothetical protein